MIFVGFAVLFCVLSAVPAYFSICRNRNPERFVLMALLTNALLFYVNCAFHGGNIGVIFIQAANLAFYVPVIKQLYREPAAWKRFFTPAMIIYFTMIPILYAATFNMEFCQWDEFSHWGITNSLLFRHNILNCEYSQYLEHASYPPGMALVYVFIHKCMDKNFFEHLIYFANLLTILTIFLNFVSDWKERGNMLVRLFGIACGSMLLFIFVDDWLFSVYSEPLLIMLGALILFRVFTTENTIIDDLELMILLMATVLIKTSALGIIVFALVFYLIQAWKHRECRNTKWQKFLPVLVCVAPFLVKASWSFLLKYHHTTIVFPVKVSWSEAIKILCSDSYTGTVAWAMCRNFCTHTTLYAMLVLIAVAAGYCLKGKNKPAEWKLLYFIFMPVFFLTMMFSLLITYLFVFSRHQADRLVSFERYTLTFIGILAFLQLFLLFREKALENVKQLRFKIAFAAVIIGCLFYTFFSLELRKSRIDVKWRKEANIMKRSYSTVLQPGCKFVVLSAEGYGIKNFLYSYLFPDLSIHVDWFDPVLPDQEPSRLYQVPLSPEQLLKNLNKTADYVLLESMDETFFHDYKAIFADGDDGYKHQALYRITPEGLKYIPPAK